MTKLRPVVYVIGCAAPPVLHLADLLTLLVNQGWDNHVILTPVSATWVDTESLAQISGNEVRVEPRNPQSPNPLPPATAIIAAPLTFNSLNKWATGISDNLALGLLNEALGLGLPIIAAPWAKDALRRHPVYGSNTTRLSSAGATLLEQEQITTVIGDLNALNWGVILEHVSSRRRT